MVMLRSSTKETQFSKKTYDIYNEVFNRVIKQKTTKKTLNFKKDLKTSIFKIQNSSLVLQHSFSPRHEDTAYQTQTCLPNQPDKLLWRELCPERSNELNGPTHVSKVS